MTCTVCHGKMRKGIASLSFDRDGYLLTVRDIPAWICPSCGEELFGEDELRLIQGMLKEMDRQAESLRKATA